MEQIQISGPQDGLTLSTLKKGARARVTGVNSADRRLSSKLLCMGIVEGADLEVLAIAPFGDPIQIRTRGYLLSLRLSEASSIRITPV